MAQPPTTAVPFPAFGPRGFVLPDEAAILAGVTADINGAFGGNLNPALETPQGQIASSETAVIGDSFAMFALFCNLVDPAYSFGRMQDAIGRIYFITRIPGAPTVQPCACAGLDGVEIPIGALAQDPTGNLWVCQQAGTIVAGVVNLDFACAANGPVAAPASLVIYQTIFGWDSVTPTGDAVLGRNVETSAEFETRRSASTGLNSMGPLNAIYAAVADLPGVLDVYAVANNNSTTQTIGGVAIPARTIFISVLGGTSADIAEAIYSRKMPGCGMAGNTTVVVTDPNPAYLPPAPTTNITFEIPAVVDCAVVVTITNSNRVPGDALSLVQAAIVSAFAGGDGGPRAKIGAMVYALRYVPPVTGISNTYNGVTGQVLPGWSAPVVSIQVGRDGAAASITGSISGNVLTVSSVASGSLAVGDLVEGTGVGNGTLISALASGTGGVGTYTLNGSQAALSQTMHITSLGNDIAFDINEAPGVAAANVHLVLQ